MKKIIFILVVTAIFGCDNDDTNDQTDMLDINLVSGINILETADQEPLKLGNPNIFTSNQLIVYPNPALDVVFIASQNTITDIYFLSANAERIHQEVDFNGVFNSNSYQETTISNLSSLKLNNQNQSVLNVDITNLDAGYYRIFIKTQGQLLWDNFYKINPQMDSESQIDALIEFWN